MRAPAAAGVEAEAALPSARYERKFLVSGLSLERILSVVTLHRASFRRTYPDRLVNNIYLDSPSLKDYFDHLAGARHRSKTRVRWYGPGETEASRPVLERKFKSGDVGGKQGYSLPAFSIGPEWRQRGLDEALSGAGLPDALWWSLRHLEPVLRNRYRRHYFENADRRFRLTIDSGLEVSRLPRSGRAWACPLRLSTTIVEVKYAPAHADGADELTGRFPFRLAQYSKYVAAMELLRGM
jgi:hypothetical protein